jgi:hypothetical protein
MDEGVLAVSSRRLFIMIVALICPELIITWATRQFFSARSTAKDFNTEIVKQRAQTHNNNRDISDRTAISLSDIGVNSSAPRPVKFPGQLHAWTLLTGWTNMQPMISQDGEQLMCSLVMIDLCQRA